jgi:MFS family permease
LSKLRNSLIFTNVNVLLVTIVAFVDFTGIGLIVPVRSLYARSMGASMFEIGLMASSFIFAEFIFQIPFGVASDKFGRRRMMLIGMTIRTIMPILYLFAANPWVFIAFRFIDGTGAAAVIPAARAYLMDSTPEEKRGEAFGILGMGTSAGLLLGPAIGGFVGYWFGYNAPYALGATMAAITLAIIYLRIHDREHAVSKDGQPKGGKLATFHRYFGWPLAGALILAVGLNWAFGLMVTLWSIWLADMGAGTDYIGLTFISFTIPIILLSGWGGQLSDRLGRWQFIIFGGVLAALMHGTYAFANPGNYFWLVLGFGAIEGLAFAFAQPAIDGYLADIIPADVRGQVQGIYNSIGLAIAFFSATFMATLYGYNHALPFIVISVVEIVCFIGGGLIVARYQRKPGVSQPQVEPQPPQEATTLALAE